MKSKLSLLVVLILSALLLCACQKNSDTQISSKIPFTDTPSLDANISDENADAPDLLLSWQKDYISFLENHKEEHLEFALVFIDNDDVPELYLSGASEATGDAVCSHKQGAVIVEYLNRTHGGLYVVRGGMVVNENGNQGNLYTDVYTLTNNGFITDFTAQMIPISEMEGVYEYTVGSETVSKEEYDAARKEAFGAAALTPLDENAVSYAVIIEQIKNYTK